MGCQETPHRTDVLGGEELRRDVQAPAAWACFRAAHELPREVDAFVRPPLPRASPTGPPGAPTDDRQEKRRVTGRADRETHVEACAGASLRRLRRTTPRQRNRQLSA